MTSNDIQKGAESSRTESQDKEERSGVEVLNKVERRRRRMTIESVPSAVSLLKDDVGEEPKVMWRSGDREKKTRKAGKIQHALFKETEDERIKEALERVEGRLFLAMDAVLQKFRAERAAITAGLVARDVLSSKGMLAELDSAAS